ncbi:MAG: tetratricopeptide repeat protein [Thermodesulfovibrionales bacterium]
MSLSEINRHIEVGNNLFNEGRYEEALRHYRKALIIDNKNPVPYYNIANILALMWKFSSAERHYQSAIHYGLKKPEVYNNLGNVLKDLGRLSDAISAYRSALSLEPNMFEALNGLGNTLLAQGLIDESIKSYCNALKLRPDNPETFSNLLLALNYHHRISPTDIFNAHRAYGEIYADVNIKRNKFKNKKIRLGYVSPDFRRHSVSYFILPILQCHNRDIFEIYCYSDVQAPDRYTHTFRSLADLWIDTFNVDHKRLFERILSDKIDILIDLAGHSAYNRLPVFAKKPSPIQITYLGYPNTTGLSTIDYRIVDPYTDPEGLTNSLNTERLLRMSDCFLCFSPETDSPPCTDPPAIKNGYITFGSLNNISKVNDLVIGLWADILLQIKDSRILIKSKALNDPSVKMKIKDSLIKKGIDEQRIILLGYIKGFYSHLEIYNLIDIALDTFPYNGTTTTFEALFMGTPVVTLKGNTHCSRVGFSILKNLCCDELIADQYDDYISICKALSLDISRLKDYKKGLRQRLLDSILTNKVEFTKRFEDLLLKIHDSN